MPNGITYGLRIDVAYATALFVETLIYGIYTCLFISALPAMAKRRRLMVPSRGRTSAWVFLLASILMYINATCHLFVATYRVFQGTIIREDPLGPIHYIENTTHWGFLADIILLCIMTWVGDALVIYRCYLVWNRNKWLIVFPGALLCASMTISTFVLYWLHNPFAVDVSTGFRAYNCIYVLAFAQNLLATSLIILKIYLQHRASVASGVVVRGSTLSLIRIVRIVVESAMVYTIQLLVLIILFFLGNNLQFVILGAIVPSIGITFVLIAHRVNIAKQRKQHSDIRTDLADNTTSHWMDDGDSEIEFSQPDSPVPTSVALRVRKTVDKTYSHNADDESSWSTAGGHPDDQKIPPLAETDDRKS